MISQKQIINTLTDQLSDNFDIQRDVFLENRKVPLLARSKLNIQQYAVSKKIVLDEVQVNDYIFCLQQKTHILEQDLYDEADWLKQVAQAELALNHEHMRSRFIGFVFSEQNLLNKKTENFFKKYYKFHWIKFGLKGWYEIFFILLFTHSLNWIIPRKGKDFIPLLENLTYKLKKI